MPQRSARAIERLCLAQRNIDNRMDKLEELSIRRFFVKVVGLVTDRVALTALHSVIVIIQHFLEGAAINHGLVALVTFPLFAFERFHRYRPKLDPLNGPPRIAVALEDLNSVKARA